MQCSVHSADISRAARLVLQLIGDGHDSLAVYSLINMAADADAAAEVHERLALACHRFLGRELLKAGHVPASDEVRHAVRTGQSFLLTSANCEAARALEIVAQQLIAPRSEPKPPHMLQQRWQSSPALAHAGAAQSQQRQS